MCSLPAGRAHAPQGAPRQPWPCILLQILILACLTWLPVSHCAQPTPALCISRSNCPGGVCNHIVNFTSVLGNSTVRALPYNPSVDNFKVGSAKCSLYQRLSVCLEHGERFTLALVPNSFQTASNSLPPDCSLSHLTMLSLTTRAPTLGVYLNSRSFLSADVLAPACFLSQAGCDCSTLAQLPGHKYWKLPLLVNGTAAVFPNLTTCRNKGLQPAYAFFALACPLQAGQSVSATVRLTFSENKAFCSQTRVSSSAMSVYNCFILLLILLVTMSLLLLLKLSAAHAARHPRLPPSLTALSALITHHLRPALDVHGVLHMDMTEARDRFFTVSVMTSAVLTLSVVVFAPSLQHSEESAFLEPHADLSEVDLKRIVRLMVRSEDAQEWLGGLLRPLLILCISVCMGLVAYLILLVNFTSPPPWTREGAARSAGRTRKERGHLAWRLKYMCKKVVSFMALVLLDFIMATMYSAAGRNFSEIEYFYANVWRALAASVVAVGMNFKFIEVVLLELHAGGMCSCFGCFCLCCKSVRSRYRPQPATDDFSATCSLPTASPIAHTSLSSTIVSSSHLVTHPGVPHGVRKCAEGAVLECAEHQLDIRNKDLAVNLSSNSSRDQMKPQFQHPNLDRQGTLPGRVLEMQGMITSSLSWSNSARGAASHEHPPMLTDMDNPGTGQHAATYTAATVAAGSSTRQKGAISQVQFISADHKGVVSTGQMVSADPNGACSNGCDVHHISPHFPLPSFRCVSLHILKERCKSFWLDVRETREFRYSSWFLAAACISVILAVFFFVKNTEQVARLYVCLDLEQPCPTRSERPWVAVLLTVVSAVLSQSSSEGALSRLLGVLVGEELNKALARGHLDAPGALQDFSSGSKLQSLQSSIQACDEPRIRSTLQQLSEELSSQAISSSNSSTLMAASILGIDASFATSLLLQSQIQYCLDTHCPHLPTNLLSNQGDFSLQTQCSQLANSRRNTPETVVNAGVNTGGSVGVYVGVNTTNRVNMTTRFNNNYNSELANRSASPRTYTQLAFDTPSGISFRCVPKLNTFLQRLQWAFGVGGYFGCALGFVVAMVSLMIMAHMYRAALLRLQKERVLAGWLHGSGMGRGQVVQGGRAVVEGEAVRDDRGVLGGLAEHGARGLFGNQAIHAEQAVRAEQSAGLLEVMVLTDAASKELPLQAVFFYGVIFSSVLLQMQMVTVLLATLLTVLLTPWFWSSLAVKVGAYLVTVTVCVLISLALVSTTGQLIAPSGRISSPSGWLVFYIVFSCAYIVLGLFIAVTRLLLVVLTGLVYIVRIDKCINLFGQAWDPAYTSFLGMVRMHVELRSAAERHKRYGGGGWGKVRRLVFEKPYLLQEVLRRREGPRIGREDAGYGDHGDDEQVAMGRRNGAGDGGCGAGRLEREERAHAV